MQDGGDGAVAPDEDDVVLTDNTSACSSQIRSTPRILRRKSSIGREGPKEVDVQSIFHHLPPDLESLYTNTIPELLIQWGKLPVLVGLMCLSDYISVAPSQLLDLHRMPRFSQLNWLITDHYYEDHTKNYNLTYWSRTTHMPPTDAPDGAGDGDDMVEV